MTLLSVNGVTKRYGGLTAVDDVSFDIVAGELVGLIGPNGSGKTTLLNILSGLATADAGEILLADIPCQRLTPEQLAHRGVMRMFQLTRVFRRMNVIDNLLVAGRALGLDHGEALTRAHALISELRLDAVAALDAGQLSGGQMKLLEFGVCFMVPPRIALLDEPFAAVHPTMKEIMGAFIRARHAKGQTFILVSHDMPVVVELCPRAICMNAGAVVIDATTREVLNDARVIEAYLGGHAA
ncbi:MAG: branched-chain amino acid ABC transporter ATP-binding protein [Proteobacteria bacterium]|nr:MAG: branched-chain amino acid ABC transporter ATP-binding protein [Pseudomonadota bacterium]